MPASKRKLSINKQTEPVMGWTGEIRRGDVFLVSLDPVIGSEQGGTRPVLVIQNDVGNHHSPVTIIARSPS